MNQNKENINPDFVFDNRYIIFRDKDGSSGEGGEVEKYMMTRDFFNKPSLSGSLMRPMAEFKEFERRFKFKPRLKYGWFHLKIVSNVSRFKPALNLNRVLADFGGFKPRLIFFKFHL